MPEPQGIQIDPTLAYEHAKREGARIVETLIGDLAAKSAAIDQLAEKLQESEAQNEKLAQRLAELEPAKESTNGKPAKDTIADVIGEEAKRLAKVKP